jgi:hypothetical protein
MVSATIILVFLLGLASTAAGVRGRRTDDHPLCRRCRFDLTGKPADSVRCPECGADLGRPRATVVGHRRWRRGPLSAGVATLAFSAAVLGTVEWGRIRHVNWLRYAPVFYLVREASSADPAHRSPALAELSARLLGNPRASNDAWSRVAAAGLNYQGDPTLPWDWAWGTLLEQARTTGHLTDAQWRRYASQVVTPAIWQLRMDDPLVAGGTVTVLVERVDARTARDGTPLFLEHRHWRATADDGSTLGQLEPTGGNVAFLGAGTTQYFLALSQVRLPPNARPGGRVGVHVSGDAVVGPALKSGHVDPIASVTIAVDGQLDVAAR